MTDREKLIELFKMFGVVVKEKPDYFTAGGRTYKTNKQGEITKVLEL